jgi:hypothetical protein
VFAYGWFIWDSRYVVRDVFLAVNLVAAIQFSVFLIGFPLIGTVLMAYILQLFQESQYNKLKTALFQELVNAKIDPRVVQVKFERKDELQERTLIDYTGENFFHRNDRAPNFFFSFSIESPLAMFNIGCAIMSPGDFAVTRP